MPAAHFCPEVIHHARRANPLFRAEVEFFDALARQLPFGWNVFYDIGWLNRLRREGPLRDGEADFILAHATHGVLAIELKGGFIRFEGHRQQWVSTDRRGVDHDIKNPFTQVKDSKHTLIDKLKELPELEQRYVAIHHAVAFPDCPRGEKINEEAPPEILIALQDMDRLEDRVLEILRHSRGSGAFRFGKEIVAGLHRLLCRTVKLANPLQAQIDLERREMQTLTDTQIEALAKMQRIRRVALSGGAGSGKTYIAVHRARLLAGQGFRTLFTCHSPRLARFLHSLLAREPNLEVLSAADLARKYAPGLLANTSETQRAEALFDAATRLPERPYDALFVDEGQDFTPDWWAALEALLREGKQSVFYVCHDTNNQVVRPGAGRLPDGLNPIDLEENIRNTRDICLMLPPHYRGEVPILPRRPPGRAVELRTYAGRAELQKELGQALHRLLVVEGVLARDIVVLTPRPPAASELSNFGLPSGIQLVEDEGFVKGRRVLWANVADFKGLERPVVLVAELDERLPADARERDALLYVAFSRPRSLLVILHTESVRPWVTPAAGL
jgi:hypothetical protein